MDPLLDQLTSSLGSAYRIERELGGGMSRVFLATELALGRRVVLKVLPPDLARDVSAERFKREISLAANLQHAHIVPLLTAGESAGVPWFTMPLVDGQSLRSRLSSGELPIAEAVRILRDVASALAYAHARGVVHRDIKPENILLADGAAFVSDFGVSKALTEAGVEKGAGFTSVGVALGTPAYMAPEQIAAERSVDHRADIYAVGVVAFEVLTGRNPFGGRSMQGTMAAHMTEVAPPVETQRSATPPVLAQLVNRCLCKSPADRPQKAQELVDALDALATPTGSMPMPASARGQSRSWRVPAATVVVVALVAGGAMWRNRTGADLDARKVAVIPFANLTGDASLAVVGRIAAEELSRSIAQTDSADVVSSSGVDAALGDVRSAATDAVQRVARATRSAIVVIGSYSKEKDSLRTQASIVDARSGRVIRALDPTMGPIADPMIAISALRERLLGSIVSGDVARKIVLGSPPPKYSAYLEFVEASKAFYSSGDTAARPYLERAIALDSTFVYAYGLLATTYTNTRNFDDAERVIGRLEAQRDRLSAYDRLLLRFNKAHNHYIADEVLPLAQEVYARGGDPIFSYLVGFWALRILRPDIALPALRISEPGEMAAGWVGQARDMAAAEHQLADYRAELAVLDRGARLVPRGAALYRTAKLRAYAGLDDSASARALADTLLRESRDTVMGAVSNVSGAAREFEAHGDTIFARELRQIAIAWLREHPVAHPSAARETATGVLWFDLRNLDSAEVHFRGAVRATGDASVARMGSLAVIAAARGDTARALAISDSLGKTTRKWDLGLTPFWRAAILANLGRRDEAIQYLVQARKTGQGMGAWHSTTLFRPLRGYPPFDQMITPKRN